MKDYEFLDAIGGIDPKYIRAAQAKKTPHKRFIMIAACIAFVLVPSVITKDNLFFIQENGQTYHQAASSDASQARDQKICSLSGRVLSVYDERSCLVEVTEENNSFSQGTLIKVSYQALDEENDAQTTADLDDQAAEESLSTESVGGLQAGDRVTIHYSNSAFPKEHGLPHISAEEIEVRR